MMINEPTTVGLTKEGKAKLQWLKEEEHFNELLDAYKLGVSYAISCNADPPKKTNVGTMFNVGSLDPDKDLYEVVKELRNPTEEPVYKTVERLAEWGITELYEMAQSGAIDFSKIIKPDSTRIA